MSRWSLPAACSACTPSTSWRKAGRSRSMSAGVVARGLGVPDGETPPVATAPDRSTSAVATPDESGRSPRVRLGVVVLTWVVKSTPRTSSMAKNTRSSPVATSS